MAIRHKSAVTGDPLRDTAAADAARQNASTGGGTAPTSTGHTTVTDSAGNTTTIATPQYLGNEFPGAQFTDFNAIDAADYNFVNPIQFSKEYSPYLRNQIKKNYQLSKEMGLDQLQTELQGLQSYAPAAAALKRNQISIDNQFNQAMRTAQVNATMPGLAGDLAAQRKRANTLATGSLPSEQDDKALELGIRANAADAAIAGGFGAKSLAGQKASSLMSAEDRLKISQYGEQLLGTNIGTTASMYLAPTEYSNAGSQINVMPEIGAGRASAAYLSDLNQATVIPASTAMANTINQEQFKTNIAQRTNEFNATNSFQESINNAGIANEFAMTKFQYDTGYAAAAAGAENTASDRNFQLQQQQLYEQLYNDSKSDTQNQNTISDVTSSIGAVSSIASVLLSANKGSSTNTSGGAVSSDQTSGTSGSTPSSSSSGNFAGEVALPSNASTGVTLDQNTVSGSSGTTGSEGASKTAYEDTSTVNPWGSSSADSQAAILSTPELSLIDDQSVAAALSKGVAINSTAGITYDRRADSQVMGVDRSGNTIYVSRAAAANTDSSAGEKYVNGLQAAVTPLGSLDETQSKALSDIGATSKDADLMAQVNALVSSKDTKGATDLVLSKIGVTGVSGNSSKEDLQAHAEAAITANSVLSNWDKMSGAQKSMAISSLGITLHKDLGLELINKPIAKTQVAGTKNSLSYGQALAAMASGVNVYKLVDNWDQLSDAQRVLYGSDTAVGTLQVARDLGLTARANQNVASAKDVTTLGYKATPAMGVNSFVAPEGTTIPKGYTLAGKVDGKQIVTQPQFADSARGALASNAGHLPASTRIGEVTEEGSKVAYSALGGQSAEHVKNWGEMSATAAKHPANAIPVNGPIASATSFISTFAGSFVKGSADSGSGKEAVLNDLKRRNIVDENHALDVGGKLASLATTGETHEARFPDKLQGSDSKMPEHAVDYTNDLDYLMGTSGVALSRLLVGGKNTVVDQVGSQIANGVIRHSTGFGKDLTADTFSQATKSMRAAYSNSGIRSKADAYQMANLAYSQGRLNDTDLYAMQKSFDLVFDADGFNKSSKLLQNRWAGVTPAVDKAKQISADLGKGKSDPTTTVKLGARPESLSSTLTSKEIAEPTTSGTQPTKATVLNFNRNSSRGKQVSRSTLALSKDAVRELNQQRYGGARL